jgi:hypothetical protein
MTRAACTPDVAGIAPGLCDNGTNRYEATAAIRRTAKTTIGLCGRSRGICGFIGNRIQDLLLGQNITRANNHRLAPFLRRRTTTSTSTIR